MLEQNIYTIGTAPTVIVAPTVDAARYVLRNMEPETRPENYARAGRVFDVFQLFEVPRNTSVYAGLTTGPTGLQIQYFEIASTASDVYAELIEGATVTFGTNITSSFNVDRGSPDNAQSVFKNVISATGGTPVNAEYIVGAGKSGGEKSFTKVITLEPNTDYVFRFTEQTGTADPNVFLQIGFAELYNGYDEIWLDTVNDSFPLEGGETLQMELRPEETLTATAIREGVKIAVMRQEI